MQHSSKFAGWRRGRKNPRQRPNFSLNSNGKSLQQILQRVQISSNLHQSVAKLTNKVLSLETQNATGLNGHWSETMITGMARWKCLNHFLSSACAATMSASAEANAEYSDTLIIWTSIIKTLDYPNLISNLDYLNSIIRSFLAGPIWRYKSIRARSNPYKKFSHFQGATETPSDLFPSEWYWPEGSSWKKC